MRSAATWRSLAAQAAGCGSPRRPPGRRTGPTRLKDDAD